VTPGCGARKFGAIIAAMELHPRNGGFVWQEAVMLPLDAAPHAADNPDWQYPVLRAGRGMRPALILAAALLLAGCAGGNRPLQLVSGTGAFYPPLAREQGIEGHVVVRYDVDVEGRVRNARAVSAAPPDVFDEAAVQAVSRWRFNAPLRAGEPQPVTGIESRLDFTLKGGDAYEDY